MNLPFSRPTCTRPPIAPLSPYKETAGILGIQEGTVKSRVFRACQMLKGRLWNYAAPHRQTRPESRPGRHRLMKKLGEVPCF
ncbi:MAG: RNA polymerase sigma factor [Phycisphaerae bacterium]